MKNYYDELEVSKNASKEVIEKVYKVLAKKYHPDMNQGDSKKEAEEKFKKISEAYEVLSNEEKRKKYDLELESLSPSISLDDYNNVINERNTLINELNSVRNELYNYKNRTSYNFNNTQNYNYRNQNINNYNTNTSQSGNVQNNNKTGSQKRTYYYTDTGKPASAFDYFKYRIREFFSNIILLVLIVLVLILMLNAFLPFNLFSLFFKR